MGWMDDISRILNFFLFVWLDMNVPFDADEDVHVSMINCDAHEMISCEMASVKSAITRAVVDMKNIFECFVL